MDVHSTREMLTLRALHCVGALVLLLALCGCAFNSGGRLGGEWVTDVLPRYACRGDTITAVWDDHLYCHSGLYYGSGLGGGGVVHCPAHPLVTITAVPPERSLVARTSHTSGHVSAAITETTTVIFDADPVIYAPPPDAGYVTALPRHRHEVRVIQPSRIEAIEALSEGTCEGARPAWQDVVIDIAPPRVRSNTVQPLRVCNLGGQAANFVLGGGGTSVTVRIEARSCLDLDAARSATLETVATTGAVVPPVAVCGPTAGGLPAPIPFSVQLACPNSPP